MNSIIIKRPHRLKETTITLPASKSICNRALIIQKILGFEKCIINNISDADDTIIMQEALKHSSGTINVKNAGTCMRFLAAYYSAVPGIDVIIHGDMRMQQRPIYALVSALKNLGADINYVNESGFPPLYIKGRKLGGGHIAVDASQSSQFISALMLAAPLFEDGLIITTQNQVVSRPYIDMTASLMQSAGFNITVNHNIVIEPQEEINKAIVELNIEPDWSAASYWYVIAALSKQQIALNGLTKDSVQGDSVLIEIMKNFGVETSFNNNGIIISPLINKTIPNDSMVFDMNNYPDLVPALTVLICALNVSCKFVNVAHLEAKESKRLTALCMELQKFNFNISHNGTDLEIKQSDMKELIKPETVHTYNDHRMAMAFAPLVFIFDEIQINNAMVVEKSYPQFWKELTKAGFLITTGQ